MAKTGEIERGAAAIRAAVPGAFPKTALILGSGLGPLAERIEGPTDISYGDIPGFPVPTVSGHHGRLRVGTLAGHRVACMQGRLHAYEGHPAQAIAAPIRILRQLGVERLILTNAAGGINPTYSPGTLMLLTDHINFSGQNPLIGANDDSIGPRFPDISHAYDPEMSALFMTAAQREGVALQSGIYVYVLGPSFETPAEIRMFATLGADAVGMSTVPECLAAVHCGMRVAGLSVITNFAAGLSEVALTHQETLAESAKAYDRVERLMLSLLPTLGE